MNWLNNIIVDLGDLAAIISVLVLLPLALFKSKRKISGAGLKWAAFVFLINLWVHALMVVWKSWGLIAVIAGVILTPLGAAIIAVIAAISHLDWMALLVVIGDAVLTAGAYAAGVAIENRAD
jgi:hypothetical protein